MLKHSQIKSLLTGELEKHKSAHDKLLDPKEIEEFLENYKGNDRIVRSDELIEKVKTEGIRQPMKTGIEDLDDILGGFYEEQVIVLTARPKSGKTAFCLDLIDKMKDRSPLFLAIEQSPLELVEQMTEKNMEIPLFYAPESIDGVTRTVDWIHLKIIESQYRSRLDGNPTKVVFIDHFGKIIMSRTSDQVTWEIIKTMQELKDIAKATKTAIIVVVHTTKGDETVAPNTGDLFGSAGYHQEADTVLSLWRECYKDDEVLKKTNNVLLQVLANRRRGETGAVKFRFDNGKFIRHDWEVVKSKKDVELRNF